MPVFTPNGLFYGKASLRDAIFRPCLQPRPKLGSSPRLCRRRCTLVQNSNTVNCCPLIAFRSRVEGSPALDSALLAPICNTILQFVLPQVSLLHSPTRECCNTNLVTRHWTSAPALFQPSPRIQRAWSSAEGARVRPAAPQPARTMPLQPHALLPPPPPFFSPESACKGLQVACAHHGGWGGAAPSGAPPPVLRSRCRTTPAGTLRKNSIGGSLALRNSPPVLFPSCREAFSCICCRRDALVACFRPRGRSPSNRCRCRHRRHVLGCAASRPAPPLILSIRISPWKFFDAMP